MPTTTNYIWDEQNYLAEADGTNTIQTVYTNEPRQYGNLISSRISGSTSYHHFDAVGSTRQLTNAAGSVTDTVVYDAWGNIVHRTGSTPTTRLWIGLLTYYTDAETGLVWVSVRPFAPAIGRWATVDPLGVTLDPNPFRYVGGRPVLLVDPSGLAPACGTAATAGSVTYVPGRGDFTEVRFGTIGSETEETRPSNGLWSYLTLQFQQNLSFRQNDCCCCKSIGFVQIHKLTREYTGFMNSLGQPPQSKWVLDDAICGVPYSNVVHDPCNVIATTPPQPASTLGPFSDTPAAPFPLFGHIITYKDEFELCVICLSSISTEKILWAGTRVSGAISYGCVTWGHEFTYVGRPDKFKWKRWFNDRSWEGEQSGATTPDSWSADKIPSSVAPKKQTKDFETVLLAYNKSTKSGCPDLSKR